MADVWVDWTAVESDDSVATPIKFASRPVAVGEAVRVYGDGMGGQAVVTEVEGGLIRLKIDPKSVGLGR